MKKVFIEGPISAEFIAESISKHLGKTDIGAHAIFLGQVRADIINHQKVTHIEYSAYEEMAHQIFHEIREECFQKFDIICMHIYHSIKQVNAGEISLFVFVSSKHRKIAFEACEWVVEQIKQKVPVFGKECFDNNNYQWKENK